MMYFIPLITVKLLCAVFMKFIFSKNQAELQHCFIKNLPSAAFHARMCTCWNSGSYVLGSSFFLLNVLAIGMHLNWYQVFVPIPGLSTLLVLVKCVPISQRYTKCLCMYVTVTLKTSLEMFF